MSLKLIKKLEKACDSLVSCRGTKVSSSFPRSSAERKRLPRAGSMFGQARRDVCLNTDWFRHLEYQDVPGQMEEDGVLMFYTLDSTWLLVMLTCLRQFSEYYSTYQVGALFSELYRAGMSLTWECHGSEFWFQAACVVRQNPAHISVLATT